MAKSESQVRLCVVGLLKAVLVTYDTKKRSQDPKSMLRQRHVFLHNHASPEQAHSASRV